MRMAHASWSEAGRDLLTGALAPGNWVSVEAAAANQDGRVEAQVGTARVRVTVDVTPTLEVLLHVSFRGPGLDMARASRHLQAFVADRIPMVPNAEWQVRVDPLQWFHFMRRYVGPTLRG